jgi:hypothetical protein
VRTIRASHPAPPTASSPLRSARALRTDNHEPWSSRRADDRRAHLTRIFDLLPRIAGTAGSPEDGEFVPKHDDFQVFEVVRSNAQDSELKNPPKNDVTEREEHEPSRAARKPLLSYASASGINVGFCQTELRDRIYAPCTARRRDRLGGLVHE